MRLTAFYNVITSRQPEHKAHNISNIINSKPWVSSTNQSINLVERVSHIELLAPRLRNDTEKCNAIERGIAHMHTTILTTLYNINSSPVLFTN